MDSRPGHAFQPPSTGDSRSPCPGLNAAANHHYLPHSGRDLSVFQLTRAIHELYSISYPLSIGLAVMGVILCGKRGKVDLADLAKHNLIEHDASLAHEDVQDGDNKNVSPRFLEEFLSESSDGRSLSWADYARLRVKREARIPAPLGLAHRGLAQGETALSIMVMGDGKQVPIDVARTWYGEEKLPPGWMPQRTLGLLKISWSIWMFGGMIGKVRQGKKVD
ncbi:Cloroperoxidase [Ceratobasidium sp. AG-I]|nr:Cloroperoxidase [Ceratobasidium sp. AG-I]